MTVSHMDVLAETVSHYDSRSAAVTATELASAMDADVETIRDCFEDFESKCLLKPVGDGYRPTVTARELLELDVDDEMLLILDAEPDA
jgi:predicted transcriptional regulator